MTWADDRFRKERPARRFFTAAGVVAVMVLAGCVSDEPTRVVQENEEPDDPSIVGPAGAEGTGTIEGGVVSDELAPIPGANVSLMLDPPWNATTSKSGTFTFQGVPPGEWRLFAQASGYEAASRQVRVAEGETEAVQFVLSPLAGRVPFHNTTIEVAYSCNEIAQITITWNTYCAPEPPRNFVRIVLGEEWRYLIYEDMWDTQDQFLSTLFPGEFGEDCPSGADFRPLCFGGRFGDSPIRMELQPEVVMPGQNATRAPPTGSFKLGNYLGYAGMYRDEINATLGEPVCEDIAGNRLGCYGVGVSLGIRQTILFTVFYVEPPLDPRSVSAIPDA